MHTGCHRGLKAAGLLALRIAIAIVFIYMGANKLWLNHDMAGAMFANKVGLPGGGSLWAYIVGGLEFLGGLMVLLGVYARYAATWLAVIMVVAMVTVHRGGPLTGYFLPISMLGATLAISGIGAGRWRLVKTECHCKDCKGATMEAGNEGGCCGGGSCGGCGPEEKK